MSPKYIFDVAFVVSLIVGNVKIISMELSTSEEPEIAPTTTRAKSDNPKLKSFMQTYEADDGNSCFLDSIKDEVLWWMNPNGTLKLGSKKFGNHSIISIKKISRTSLCDLVWLTATKVINFHASGMIKAFLAT